MKHLTYSLLCFILGFLMGSVLPFGGAPKGELAIDSQEPTVDHAAQLREKELRIDKLNADLIALEQENSELLAKQKTQEAQQPLKPEWAMNNMLSVVVNMSSDHAVSQGAIKVKEYKNAFNLSPDQVATLEKFYTREAEHIELAMAAMSGDKAASDRLQSMKDEATYKNEKQLMADILTPEQKADYDAMQSARQAEKREADAYTELAKMQKKILMNDEQKDAVFAVEYERKYKLSEAEKKALREEVGKENFSLELRRLEQERYAASLEDVLDEDQMATLKQQQDRELRMIEKSKKLVQGVRVF